MRAGFLTLFALMGATAFADEGAVEYRQHTMEAIGGHTQAFVDILQGKVPHQEHMALHADSIAAMAQIVGLLFADGTAGGNSLPAVWEQPDDFASRVVAFREAADGLRDTVAANGEIGPAIQALGQSCKGCHDNYREK